MNSDGNKNKDLKSVSGKSITSDQDEIIFNTVENQQKL